MAARPDDSCQRPSAGRLRVRRVPVPELTSAQVERLWSLYERFYDNVDRPTFDRDLAAKDIVLLGTDLDTDAIVGFSTAVFFEHTHEGRTVGFYFSGDTVFLPRYWGQKGLHWATLQEWAGWKLRHPTTPLYWLLICSGHRTYLSLVRNFPTYWPHHLRQTPRFERGLIDAIGRRRFGPSWDSERGVVSTGGVQPVFKAAVAPLDGGVRELPEIRFFLERNPHHARGDELAMIARVDASALGWMASRWLGRPVRRWGARWKRGGGGTS